MDRWSTYTPDPYWKSVLEDAQEGKFNHQVWHNTLDHTIAFQSPNNKTDRVYLDISALTPELIAHKLIELHQVVLGHMSPTDLEYQLESITKMKDDYESKPIEQWADVNRTAIGTTVIVEYIKTKKTQYSLSVSTIRKCIQDVLVAIDTGMITAEHIMFTNHVISDIQGLTFKKNRYRIHTRVASDTSHGFKNRSSRKVNGFQRAIDQYIEKLSNDKK